MTKFGEMLRQRAQELELSDAEVARRAGLNERRYGHYVAGSREPDFETMLRICNVLGTTPNALLGFDTSEPSGKGRARRMDEAEAIRDRLATAGNTLSPENLRLAVALVETLLHFQLEEQSGTYPE